MIDIDKLTIGEARKLAALFSPGNATIVSTHPMIGRRGLVRTYSAGVHIGEVVSVSPDGMQVHLKDGLRLWKWSGGGLSLSDVATKGIKGGRLNRTPEVHLSNAIEIIPTTEEAEKSYVKFIE